MGIPDVQNVFLVHVNAFVQRAVVHFDGFEVALELRHVLELGVDRHGLEVRSANVEAGGEASEKRCHVVQNHLDDAQPLPLPFAQRLETAQLQTRAEVVFPRPLIRVATYTNHQGRTKFSTLDKSVKQEGKF